MPLLSFRFNPKDGPIVKVRVCLGTTEVGRGDSLPYREVGALIDTGADVTCVSHRLTEDMGWTPSGFSGVASASGRAKAKTFFLEVRVPIEESHYGIRGELLEYQALSSDTFHVLLGRDILCKGIFQIQFDGVGIIGF